MHRKKGLPGECEGETPTQMTLFRYSIMRIFIAAIDELCLSVHHATSLLHAASLVHTTSLEFWWCWSDISGFADGKCFRNYRHLKIDEPRSVHPSWQLMDRLAPHDCLTRLLTIWKAPTSYWPRLYRCPIKVVVGILRKKSAEPIASLMNYWMNFWHDNYLTG